MNLQEINHSDKIRNMKSSELKQLCQQIRDSIIEQCAIHGGYLSSNLSCVEISVVLSQMFNAKDKILFEGNHMDATHRILHGDSFIFSQEKENRFVLAQGLGEAIALRQDHKEGNVVCVLNAQDLSEGRNFEALDLISREKNKLILVFNDDTTISKGIGFIDRMIAKLRNTKSYNSLKENVKDLIRPVKHGEEIIENIGSVKDKIRKTVVDEGIFGDLDLEYIGPINGHDIDELKRAFQVAIDKESTVVVHCITTKGKGYRFAESDTSDSWNLVTPFNKDSGKLLCSEDEQYCSPESVLVSQINHSMELSSDLYFINANSRIRKDCESLFSRFPLRCIEAQGKFLISLAAAKGLAKENKIPVILSSSKDLSDALVYLQEQVEGMDSSFVIAMKKEDDFDYRILEKFDHLHIYEAGDICQIRSIIELGIHESEPVLLLYPACWLKKTESDSADEVGIWKKSGNNDINDVLILSSGKDFDQISNMIEKNDLPYTACNPVVLSPIDDNQLELLLNGYKHVFVYGNLLESKLLHLFNTGHFKASVCLIEKKGIDYLFNRIRDINNA